VPASLALRSACTPRQWRPVVLSLWWLSLPNAPFPPNCILFHIRFSLRAEANNDSIEGPSLFFHVVDKMSILL
jgi:hypothetical protein